MKFYSPRCFSLSNARVVYSLGCVVRIVQHLRSELFANIVVQDINFFDANMTGELTSRMMNDVGYLTAPIRQFLNVSY